MPQTFRRIVTGKDARQRSVVVEDAPIEETGGAGNFNFWSTAPEAADRAAVPFFPRSDGTVFRVFRIPPAPPGLTRDDLERMSAGFFAELGDPGCKVDTSRHPFMHQTPTTDYIMLLSGKAALLLDEGEPVDIEPFDAVVQRGTNHMWLNTGDEDAVFLAVMIGTGSAGG